MQAASRRGLRGLFGDWAGDWDDGGGDGGDDDGGKKKTKLLKIVHERRVNLGDADDVGVFVGELRQKFREAGHKPGLVRVTWTEE